MPRIAVDRLTQFVHDLFEHAPIGFGVPTAAGYPLEPDVRQTLEDWAQRLGVGFF